MRCTWLHRAGNAHALVFFNGWGMDARAVAHLQPAGYDVLEVHDYCQLAALPPALADYKHKHLVAWSTGVMVSGFYPAGWTSAVALNGTGRTVDAAYGIAPRAFDVTIRRFSAAVCAAFMSNAALSVPCRAHATLCAVQGWQGQEKNFSAVYCDESSLDALRDELIAIRALVPPPPLVFSQAFVADADVIMPAASQRAYWAGQGLEPCALSGGHYPFAAFATWAELAHD